MTKKILLFFLILFSGQQAFAECPSFTFGSPQLQTHIYSDGRTWDFSIPASVDIERINVESFLGGPAGSVLSLELLINGVSVHGWTHTVSTTYVTFSETIDGDFQLEAGDTVTYRISGGTLGTAGGGIAGPNTIALVCSDTPPDEPDTPPDEPDTPPDEPDTPPDEPDTPPDEPGDTAVEWFRNPQTGHYYSVTPSMGWLEARAIARERQGDLVIIDNQEENDWIVATFGQIRNPNGYNALHIGLTDQGAEGEWRWVDGSPADFTRWNEAEPNNMVFPECQTDCDENYAQIMIYDSPYAPGEWNDINDLEAYPGVVERETPPDNFTEVPSETDYDRGYETGKEFCRNNPEACGITDQSVDYDRGYADGIEAVKTNPTDFGLYDSPGADCSGTDRVRINSDLSFRLSHATYDAGPFLGDMNIWAVFEYHGEQSGKSLWKLTEVGTE